MSESLTLEKLISYKDANKDILEELRKFANNMNFKVKPKRNIGNKKESFENKTSWILDKKIHEDKNEKIYMEIRLILNRLADDNIKELAEELINININKKIHMEKLAEFIFLKATNEQKFCDLYSKLSKELVSYYIIDNSIEGKKEIFFRELLITRCQIAFNKCFSNSDQLMTKEKILGCIIFIGTLYNNFLLTNGIINSCFSILFIKISSSEYVIDSICTLMKIVGKKFCQKAPQESQICFEKMEKLKDSSDISKKDKFMIMDLLDLKKDENW